MAAPLIPVTRDGRTLGATTRPPPRGSRRCDSAGTICGSGHASSLRRFTERCPDQAWSAAGPARRYARSLETLRVPASSYRPTNPRRASTQLTGAPLARASRRGLAPSQEVKIRQEAEAGSATDLPLPLARTLRLDGESLRLLPGIPGCSGSSRCGCGGLPRLHGLAVA